MANFPTIAIGLPFVHDLGLNADAVTHFNRVIADGGVVPQGLTGVNFVFNQLQLAIGSGYLAASATCYDPEYLGYKLGTGSGITLGQATQKLYAIGGSGFDVVQNTVASQPLLLTYSNSQGNYYFMSRTTGNSITSGTALGFNIADNTLIITSKIFLNSQNAAGAYDNLCGQNTLFNLQVSNSGASKLIRFVSGSTAAASSSYTPNSTQPHWVRCTVAPSGITYEWSSDNVTYTSIGTSAITTAGTTGTLTIGGTTGSTANVTSIYTTTLQNVTTSTTLTFEPNNYLANTSQTSWTGGGATWTINTGTATTGFKGVLVNRTIVQSPATTAVPILLSSTFTAISNRTLFAAFNAYSSGFSYVIDDGVTPVRNGIVKSSGEVARIYLNTGAVATDVATGSINTLKLITAFVGANTQSIQYNNGTAVTSGAITPSTTVGVCMFSRPDGGSPSNASLTSFFMLNMTTDATIRTAIYNLLKTMNNNAF
jgi:hypothetical protein